MRLILVLAALLPVAADCEQSYRVYTEHPRLWLDARRLRLLRRERERDSIRWQQLQLLAKGPQSLPEESLVRALEYQVTGQEEAGRRAVAWAVARATGSGTPDAAELRLLAVVFDWCYPLLPEADRTRVTERMARGVSALTAQPGVAPFSSAVLAAVALADDWPGSEAALAGLFQKRWADDLQRSLREGRGLEAPADRAAFLELCFAARDNLHLELWSQAPVFFRQFPIYLLLEYYPEPVTVAGHRFRQAAAFTKVPPDPVPAGELSRRVELLTAAYETNSNETQFLQGWITHDIYRLRSPSGAVYEFLWMNPYQPGLSYYAVPLHLYDELGGTVLARSSWDDHAAWVGYRNGELELFADGQRSAVGPTPPAAPIVFPQLAVLRVSGESVFQARLAEGRDVFVVGLEPGKTYWVQAGEGKFTPQVAARGGILHLEVEPGADTRFVIRTSDPNPPPSLERKKRR